MMNNTVHAKEIALNEAQLTSNTDKVEIQLSEDSETSKRSFGLADIWSIRRSARTFKIHNRIPRL